MLRHQALDRTQSTSELYQTSGIPRNSIRRILKPNRPHPNQIKLVLALNAVDDERSLKLC